MAVDVDVLALIGFACESLFYGAYCVLFAASIYVLYSVKKSRGLNKVIVALHCCLFTACTLHYALEFNHFYTILGSSGVDGFANETYHLFIADCTVSVADFFGDLVLIYRCWIIWGYNYWIIILPLLSAAAGLICSAVVGHLVTGTTSATVNPSIVPLGLASFTLPLATNLMVTSLIVGRIWFMSRGTAMYNLPTHSTTRKAMSIIVESGALYFVVQFIFVVVYGLNHPSEVILIEVACQTYGIASTLIIIHVGLGLSWEQTSKSATISGLSWASMSRSRGPGLSVDMSSSSGLGRSTGLTQDDDVELVVPKLDGKDRLTTAISSGSSLAHVV
ncbi:hypothetical protein PHLGIDRAFT_24165 [Phlebiopsis gigantea 11061_1 CR5-6]|uniref:Uncharacterized protein n=1 Tax=Phlebiopsis gigantea (strain 11061_1 CR5-6) TaxID=745531 RepID=A0A0C3S8B0_PHLG1|nr:hypothetical protein PHLGIDRAFT_24165 [Phlebiopsis gigantea 11061_1 CR5-6]